MKTKLNLFLAVLVVMIALPSCSTAQKSNSEGKAVNVEVAEFKKLVEANPEGQIIDVRTPGEYAEGNLNGSKMMDINGKDFKDQLETLDKKAPVYVYCRSGGRSGRAMQMMSDMGFTEVYNMSGGFMAWSEAGYPSKK